MGKTYNLYKEKTRTVPPRDQTLEPFNCEEAMLPGVSFGRIQFPVTHLHVEERGSVAAPLSNDVHVLEHGLVLMETLESSPLLQNVGSGSFRLLLHPHLHHGGFILKTALLPQNAAPLQALQKAAAPLLQSPSGASSSSRVVQNTLLDSAEGINVLQVPAEARGVSVEVLQTERRQLS